MSEKAPISIRGDVCEYLAVLKPMLGSVKDRLRLQAKWVLQGAEDFRNKITQLPTFRVVVAIPYGKTMGITEEFFMKYKCINAVADDYEFFLRFRSFVNIEIKEAAKNHFISLSNVQKGTSNFLFVAYPVYYPMLFYFAPVKVDFESTSERFAIETEIAEMPEFPAIVRDRIIPIIQESIQNCI